MQPFLAKSVDNLKNMDPLVWKTESKMHRSKAFVLCCAVDAPARAAVLNMVQFDGQHGCPRCLAVATHREDTLAYTHPDGIEDWVDDTREWPEIGQLNIAYYLVEANACDLRQVCNYKALESYNYVQSGWVGQLLAHKVNDEVVLVKPSGEVLRAGYTCVAGQGRVCSHVGAVLWKIESAVSRGLTGKACTDFAAAWNKGTKRNVEPSNIEDINFKLPRTSVDPDPLAQRQPRDMLVPLGKQEIQELHRDSGYAGLFNVPGEREKRDKDKYLPKTHKDPYVDCIEGVRDKPEAASMTD
ncbi:hypothetical protein HPB50_010460 [Hyalomma asiaticum]|uniref:Uncharacterized protein n=1 Tax=Hyalomma asiaticum TaxID=266040 RepID=A0ACB7TI32_HYAAI|nr:hypothetical protein HPB50_010460 [Hyalomma asiaticum]